MSARKTDKSAFKPVILESRQTHLSLNSDSVLIRKNGIEFFSPHQLDPWVEMTVELESPRDGKKIKCSGIVVTCAGSPQSGYSVSMVFAGLNRQSEAALDTLARA
jgi:hypothetical protein